jgi:N-hydroxyarylamine O-acetyltransferase
LTDLHRYLRRIDYGGPLSPTLMTLRALHRAHLTAISYENIDVQMGRPVPLDVDATFAKIVDEGRGGWCYEMNGLFAWALHRLGFDVQLLGAGANQQTNGETAAMNHLALLVRLDRPYLADVGFGNGFITPIPLAEGRHSDGRFEFRLARIEDRWRFYNHRHSGDSFDFDETPHALDDFGSKNAWLQSSSDSPFVQNLVCHRFTDDGVTTLRGAVLQTYTPDGTSEEIAQSAAHLATILERHFQLSAADIDALWERVAERHKVWLRRKIRGF